MYNDIDYWFTTDTGVHVPVRHNETKEAAIQRTFNENNIQSKPTEKITNRKQLTSYVKEQINMDLESMATERQSHPRSYLNIDTRNLTPSEFNQLKNVLKDYGHDLRIESNGVHDYAITYERK